MHFRYLDEVWNEMFEMLRDEEDMKDVSLPNNVIGKEQLWTKHMCSLGTKSRPLHQGIYDREPCGKVSLYSQQSSLPSLLRYSRINRALHGGRRQRCWLAMQLPRRLPDLYPPPDHCFSDHLNINIKSKLHLEGHEMAPIGLQGILCWSFWTSKISEAATITPKPLSKIQWGVS